MEMSYFHKQERDKAVGSSAISTRVSGLSEHLTGPQATSAAQSPWAPRYTSFISGPTGHGNDAGVATSMGHTPKMAHEHDLTG